MALCYGKVTFEDVTVTEYFGKAWSAGAKGETPFGGLPILVVDEEPPLAQSGAIMRYVCKTLVSSLTPEDPLMAARCDSLFEASQELATGPTNVNPIVNVFRGDTYAAKRKEFFDQAPAKIANLAKQLDESSGPFFLGSEPFYCDLSIHHVLSNTLLLEPTALDAYPKVKDFMAQVAALPGIADYLEERPDPVDIGTAPMLREKTEKTKRQKTE
eukprot:CAMPEP_0174745282 /NCGR_PEP_ID=MMETSP1094-20130205/86421_1 /TAXON_ID=156173 /ORGANISM="Chrysochromulina brevifilum, Strain UTEX LB 985" /LENGTH=213 /DNA_ID=CAMNT_0015949813 /DNA_START=23 /DNA_END=664 /DNA_ORIENTATION=-